MRRSIAPGQRPSGLEMRSSFGDLLFEYHDGFELADCARATTNDSADARNSKRSVRDIRIVNDSTWPLTATFHAEICRDIDFNGTDVRFDAFQEQPTMTNFALHGRRRFNKAAHSLPPYDKARPPGPTNQVVKPRGSSRRR